MKPVVSPKKPEAAWLARFLEPAIIGAPAYNIDTPKVDIKLDQNESPWDWPEAIKKKIVDKLVAKPWNRYPGAFTDELADKVAAYGGFAPGSVLLGPGSNYLVSLTLTVFSKNETKVVIARPSFPLYEAHCTYEGIPYEPWPLNEQMEYDEKLLPRLDDNTMLVFASPNNPVGNALPKASFARLLEKHPGTLFVADEAYCEYTAENYADLLGKHQNLILIRTFSKTLGCAGVRIGYVAAHPEYLGYLKKLRLPYLLNHFSIAAAEVILEDPETKAYLERTRDNAIRERARVFEGVSAVARAAGFFVKESEANFILVKWPTAAGCLAAYEKLIAERILVRNVSAGAGLAGCLRITIGDERENDRLLAAARQLKG